MNTESYSNATDEKSNVLEIVKEDILRLIGESKGKVSLDDIKSEIKYPFFVVSQVISELQEEGSIELKKGYYRFIGKDREKADDILRKHLAIENYFKGIKTDKEAHEIAHIIEHYVSQEVIDKIESLSTLKEGSVSLTNLSQNDKGVVSDFKFADYGLFERIISMGIFPGEKIKIVCKIPDGIVIEINNKKIALGNDIAKKIRMIKHENS